MKSVQTQFRFERLETNSTKHIKTSIRNCFKKLFSENKICKGLHIKKCALILYAHIT